MGVVNITLLQGAYVLNEDEIPYSAGEDYFNLTFSPKSLFFGSTNYTSVQNFTVSYPDDQQITPTLKFSKVTFNVSRAPPSLFAFSLPLLLCCLPRSPVLLCPPHTQMPSIPPTATRGALLVDRRPQKMEGKKKQLGVTFPFLPLAPSSCDPLDVATQVTAPDPRDYAYANWVPESHLSTLPFTVSVNNTSGPAEVLVSTTSVTFTERLVNTSYTLKLK